MKPALILAAATLFAVGPAEAISRYSSTRMSCAAAKAAIASEGAAIMRWTSQRNPGLPLYGRYVLDGRFCRQGEYAAYAFIPTADTPNCPVYECKQVDFDHDDVFRFGR